MSFRPSSSPPQRLERTLSQVLSVQAPGPTTTPRPATADSTRRETIIRIFTNPKTALPSIVSGGRVSRVGSTKKQRRKLLLVFSKMTGDPLDMVKKWVAEGKADDVRFCWAPFNTKSRKDFDLLEEHAGIKTTHDAVTTQVGARDVLEQIHSAKWTKQKNGKWSAEMLEHWAGIVGDAYSVVSAYTLLQEYRQELYPKEDHWPNTNVVLKTEIEPDVEFNSFQVGRLVDGLNYDRLHPDKPLFAPLFNMIINHPILGQNGTNIEMHIRENLFNKNLGTPNEEDIKASTAKLKARAKAEANKLSDPKNGTPDEKTQARINKLQLIANGTADDLRERATRLYLVEKMKDALEAFKNEFGEKTTMKVGNPEGSQEERARAEKIKQLVLAIYLSLFDTFDSATKDTPEFKEIKKALDEAKTGNFEPLLTSTKTHKLFTRIPSWDLNPPGTPKDELGMITSFRMDNVLKSTIADFPRQPNAPGSDIISAMAMVAMDVFGKSPFNSPDSSAANSGKNYNTDLLVEASAYDKHGIAEWSGYLMYKNLKKEFMQVSDPNYEKEKRDKDIDIVVDCEMDDLAALSFIRKWYTGNMRVYVCKNAIDTSNKDEFTKRKEDADKVWEGIVRFLNENLPKENTRIDPKPLVCHWESPNTPMIKPHYDDAANGKTNENLQSIVALIGEILKRRTGQKKKGGKR